MKYRKPLRLYSHNYSDPKSYFVTIKLDCDLKFGKIINDQVQLNKLGMVVEKCWIEIPRHFRYCELKEYVIMPDHIHGIIRITSARGVGDKHACSPHDDTDQNNAENMGRRFRNVQILPKAIGGFKSAVSRILHKKGYWEFKWQRSFNDRIIRITELERFRTYIKKNPKKIDKTDDHIEPLIDSREV